MERRGIMTNKELAKILDVSGATVSLVLNGKSGISDKTRKSVIARIKELGYQDMLKECTEGPVIQTSQKSAQNIGFILYKDGGQLLGMNSFFPLIFDGIESTARKYNYTLSVINIEKEQLKTQIQYIRDADCRAFVVFATLVLFGTPEPEWILESFLMGTAAGGVLVRKVKDLSA